MPPDETRSQEYTLGKDGKYLSQGTYRIGIPFYHGVDAYIAHTEFEVVDP